MTADRYLTKDELATHLNLTPRGVECLVARRKIPVYRLSAKCVRFKLTEVEAALKRFEQKACE